MLTENKEIVKKINAAFSNGNKEYILSHLHEDVKWNIVGMPGIKGKHDFLRTMEMMELVSVPDITIKNIIAEGDYVVVESSGNTNNLYTPSYCDIFRIRNGKVQELTTYLIDITVNNDIYKEE